MQKITNEQLEKEHYLLYIHTPFCGTCQVARTMLSQIERIHNQDIFYEMNASLYPEYMHKHQIESVPCLVVKDNGDIKEKIYAFRSVANIYSFLMTYEPSLFNHKE